MRCKKKANILQDIIIITLILLIFAGCTKTSPQDTQKNNIEIPDEPVDIQNNPIVVSEDSDTCGKQDERFSPVDDRYPNSCCNGLNEVYYTPDSVSIEGKCYDKGTVSGWPMGTCLQTECGNEICESGEGPCNCRKDCEGDIESSQYKTIKEFCEKADSILEKCEEEYLKTYLAICKVC